MIMWRIICPIMYYIYITNDVYEKIEQDVDLKA